MISTNIFSLLFGGLLKIYDDVYDIETFKKYFSNLSIETIKGLILVLLTLISKNDINVPIIIFLGHVLLSLADDEALNSEYYKAGMIITFILFFLVLHNSEFNLLPMTITLLCSIFGLIIDHKLFPENYSLKKIIGRSIGFILVSLIIILSGSFIIKPIFYISLGYLFISVINMTLNETINIIGKIKVDIIGNIITNKSNVNILFKKIFNDNNDIISKKSVNSKIISKDEVYKSDIKNNEKQSSE